MPFRSEKQRRFLWAEHPELAKRWAHEYPTKKKLPMYASDSKKDTKLDTDSKQADFSPGAAARDTAAAAGLSTLGTTAGLAAAGMLSKRVGSPMLQQLFNNAARESVLFFNPMRSYRLLKRLPNAAVLSARQLELSDKLVNSKLPQTIAGVNKRTVNKATQAYRDVQKLQNQTQRYVTQHGELPTETLEKGIGVANGVMNLGVGGVVGFLPHVTGSAGQSPINAAFANKPPMTTYKQSAVNAVALDIYRKLSKQADTKEVYIEQPASDKPTVAGENPPKVVKTKGERCNSETKPNYGGNTLMAKLSAVLSQPIMQAIENERAEQEAREAARMPANAGIKRYAMPAMGTPLPMGMQAQAPQAQPQAPAAQPAQAQQQPDKQQQAQQIASQLATMPKPGQDAQVAQIAQTDPELGKLVSELLAGGSNPPNMGSPAPSGQLPPVGGGSSPNANPINSYGAISSTGDINGNAAFGTANSVGGEKLAAGVGSVFSSLLRGTFNRPNYTAQTPPPAAQTAWRPKGVVNTLPTAPPGVNTTHPYSEYLRTLKPKPAGESFPSARETIPTHLKNFKVGAEKAAVNLGAIGRAVGKAVGGVVKKPVAAAASAPFKIPARPTSTDLTNYMKNVVNVNDGVPEWQKMQTYQKMRDVYMSQRGAARAVSPAPTQRPAAPVVAQPKPAPVAAPVAKPVARPAVPQMQTRPAPAPAAKPVSSMGDELSLDDDIIKLAADWKGLTAAGLMTLGTLGAVPATRQIGHELLTNQQARRAIGDVLTTGAKDIVKESPPLKVTWPFLAPLLAGTAAYAGKGLKRAPIRRFTKLSADSPAWQRSAGILSRIIKKAAGGLDFNQWHGKAFKIVTTPPGKAVKSHTDGTPVANEPGQVSIVTPENGEAWNWPDAPAETINNFKQNWGNIQSGIAGYKMEQIQRAMMSHGAFKAQPPGSGAQTAAPPPTPPTSEPPAPPAAPEPIKTSASSPAWQRSAGKNPEGGLNEKGRKSYERETGGNLKAPVTEKNPKGEAKKRQDSFCSRMCGMKRVNTGAKTKSDPDSRINKSLRKWNCKCSSAMEFGAEFAKLAAEDVKKKEPTKPGLGHSMAWYLGGMPATNAAIGVPLTAYMNRVARPDMYAAPTLESSQAWQQLSDYAKGQGVDVTDSLNVASKIDPKKSPKATGNWFGDLMNNIKYRMRRSAADSVRNSPAFYTPANPGIGISKPTIGHSWRVKNPGVLAHEIGHHMGGKWLMRGNQIGRPAIGLGTAGALLSNNEDNSRNSAIAGTVGSVPMLASEFDASRRGAKLMRQMKLKGGRSAFIGLPTYMLASSAPMLAHYGKKTLGGFKADAAARQQPAGKPGR